MSLDDPRPSRRCSRRAFLALSASAPLIAATAACSSTSTAITPPGAQTPLGPVPTLNPGTQVPDLRFGYAPLPPTAPGYDPAGDAKALVPAGFVSPATAPIAGTQSTGSYAPNERYVVRVPQNWNGKLVVAGTPSGRSEFANDLIWSDFILSLGYAFASSNKGIPYNTILETTATAQAPNAEYPVPFNLLNLETNEVTYRYGAIAPQKIPISEWNDDFATLTIATQFYLKKNFGRAPTRTYAVGLSNGGAQVRSLLEQHPDLVDGGVDWSGPYWSPQQNILTYLPMFLKAMPAYVASGYGDASAATSIQGAGFPPDRKQGNPAHPSLWLEYYSNQPSFYSDFTVFVYALLIDPTATSSITTGTACASNPTNPILLPGTCANASGLAVPQNRASYQLSAQGADAIKAFQHTGQIGKPLISIAGTADMFITPQNNATPYLNAVVAAGRGALYHQYLVDGGTHVDSFAPFGYGLQPQYPFAWAAFGQLVGIVENALSVPGAGTAQTVSAPSQIQASAAGSKAQ